MQPHYIAVCVLFFRQNTLLTHLSTTLLFTHQKIFTLSYQYYHECTTMNSQSTLYAKLISMHMNVAIVQPTNPRHA